MRWSGVVYLKLAVLDTAPFAKTICVQLITEYTFFNELREIFDLRALTARKIFSFTCKNSVF